MPTWNAYKIFKNGKRAKNPYKTFESEEAEHFYKNILPELPEKLQKAKWVVLDSEESQERKTEQVDEAKQKFDKKKIKFLSNISKNKFPEYSNKKTEACLMMNKHTEWKWAWCVAEAATLRFLGQLSDGFKTQKQAQQWISNSISM